LGHLGITDLDKPAHEYWELEGTKLNGLLLFTIHLYKMLLSKAATE